MEWLLTGSYRVNGFCNDSSPVDGFSRSSSLHPLRGHVQEIHAADAAFAAILSDGRIVTWGDPNYGGDNKGVQNELKYL